MNQKKYSVLMSVYFKEKPSNFDKALKSISNQTLKPSQIVIVKDGPLNEPLEGVISDFIENNLDIKVKIIENEHNIGLGKSLRRGIEYCENELIARADTDDIFEQHRMELQLSEFNKNSELAVCGSLITEFSGDTSNTISIRNVPKNHEDIVIMSKSRNPICHMSVMFKKEAVILSGNYEDFPFFEDYFLWIRMIENGYKFSNIQESLVFARVEDDFYSRRGGFQYFVKEYRFQKELKNRNYINNKEYVKNLLTRCLVRLLPKKVLSSIYLKYTRQKVVK